jgi:aspartate aminotransferase
MNHLLSDRINNLATSQTLAMAALAKRLKHKERDIISLENLILIPDFIKEAAKKAIDENYTLFSSRWIIELCNLKDLDYKPSQIVVSTGAKQSLYNIAQVMLNDSDEVYSHTGFLI